MASRALAAGSLSRSTKRFLCGVLSGRELGYVAAWFGEGSRFGLDIAD